MTLWYNTVNKDKGLNMVNEFTNIKVLKVTREVLKKEAKLRGMSLYGYLESIAKGLNHGK